MAEKKYKISIELNSKELKRDLSQAKTAIAQFTNQSTNQIKKTDIAFGSFVGSFAAGALSSAISTAKAAIVDFASVSIQVATDAQETIQKFNVVFRDVSEEANKAASDLAEGYGLAQTESKKLLSDTADLLTGFGFTGQAALDLAVETNKLAADLASFSNVQGGTKTASEALTKALLGERESVKQLGISILEEDVKKQVAINTTRGLTFESLRQAKAYATLQLATKQSQNAIGDYSRSSDSAANVNRRLANTLTDIKEAVGRGLLPALTRARLAFIKFFDGIGTGRIEKITKKLADLFDPETYKIISFNFALDSFTKDVKRLEKELSELKNPGVFDTFFGSQVERNEKIKAVEDDLLKARSAVSKFEKKLVDATTRKKGNKPDSSSGGSGNDGSDEAALAAERENKITEAIVNARYERQEILDELDLEYDEIKLTQDEERSLERIDMAVAFKEVEISNLKSKKEQELQLEKLYEDQKLAQAKVYEKARERQKAAQRQLELQQEATFWSAAIGLSTSGNKELAMIGKAAALTNIAMKTPDAIASSFAFGARTGGPILGAVLGGVAAAAMAAQAAQVAGITGFETGGVISNGTDTGDRTLIRANRKERVLTAEQNRAFEQIAFNGATSTETNAILQSINMNMKNPTPIFIDGEKLTDEINARQARRLK